MNDNPKEIAQKIIDVFDYNYEKKNIGFNVRKKSNRS
ncbi:hypothetical protein WKT22_02207 [Candidatus Lokiarchaeum ossiferum]